MNEIITRSGYLMIKPNVSFADTDLSDGVKCKLGIVPKDLEKIGGKPIYITIRVNGAGGTYSDFTIPVNLDKTGVYGFNFEYSGQTVSLFPDDDNVDDWTMMYD